MTSIEWIAFRTHHSECKFLFHAEVSNHEVIGKLYKHFTAECLLMSYAKTQERLQGGSGCNLHPVWLRGKNSTLKGGRILPRYIGHSGSTVVTMTSRVDGTMEILTPCRSETPKKIKTSIGQNDYVVGPFDPSNFCRNRSKVVCSPYSWNITLLWLCVIPSLSFPSFFSCCRLQQHESRAVARKPRDATAVVSRLEVRRQHSLRV